ncbi:MAG: DUF2147 domain-containing protein [Treponema sp.]|jgi:uncharacterized protein (DUF2147 family)|nr:DUF2147 domain-containing protein [Treponema sp.]
MKNVLCVLLIAAFAAGAAFAADPVEGFWISRDEKTGKDTGGWQIYQERGVLFGRLLSGKDVKADTKADKCIGPYKGFPEKGTPSELTVLGQRWIFGLTRVETGSWSGGSVINPEDGKVWNCKIIFHAADGKKFKVDTLEMRGSWGPFGRSQYWPKATEAQVLAIK